MKLHVLPVRTGAAAENMALDFLLLQRYPEEEAPRFRHYEWRRPAFTFGYSQKIEFVRANLPSFAKASEGTAAGENFDLCRRPTGGGIVDHRNDWTYTLVLPRGHPLYDERAAQSYRIVHECLAAALGALGQPAAVKMNCDEVERVAPSALGGASNALRATRSTSAFLTSAPACAGRADAGRSPASRACGGTAAGGGRARRGRRR